MSWQAIVPLKRRAERKTRLAARLSPGDRFALSERMAAHVLSVLAEAGIATSVLSLAATDGVGWEPDLGQGLNAELNRVRGEGPLLVVHADLPLLAAADLAALIEAAEAHGAAIAPDRRAAGTNAVALHRVGAFGFAFGIDSFTRHCAALPHAAIIRRRGLAFDVDTPADLDAVAAILGTGSPFGVNRA